MDRFTVITATPPLGYDSPNNNNTATCIHSHQCFILTQASESLEELKNQKELQNIEARSVTHVSMTYEYPASYSAALRCCWYLVVRTVVTLQNFNEDRLQSIRAARLGLALV